MSRSLSVVIGESFADTVLTDGAEVRFRRWYFGRDGFIKSFPTWLKTEQLDQLDDVRVVSQFVDSLVKRNLTSTTAFLTTSGFEAWMDLNVPFTESHLTAKAHRRRHPLDEHLVFGVKERTNAQGEVVQALELPDLEFLVAKLEMNQIKNLAIGFLHATKNPTNERAAAEVLRSKGFNVVCSHNFPGLEDERPRWWRAFLTAALNSAWQELWTTVTTTVQSVSPQARVSFWTTEGWIQQADSSSYLAAWNAHAGLAAQHARKQDHAILHLGLENFFFVPARAVESSTLDTPLGPVQARNYQHYNLAVQPTALIAKSFWGTALATEDLGSFDPGPICFGKAVQLQFIDLLHHHCALANISGFSERIQAKSQSRLSEAIRLLGTDRDGNLEHVWNQLRDEIHFLLATTNSLTQPLLVTGALAEALKPLLAKSVPTTSRWDSGLSMAHWLAELPTSGGS